MKTRQLGKPIIPTTITVHLGPPESQAEEVHISFIDYIKNVACSELYPSWPESAIRSNVLAQVSFALNRIYSEWYPSKGFSFDITSLPEYDQTFKKGRDLFDNIVKIVDEIFNNYIVKGNHVEPFFAKYCDGKNTLCEGLSQWGSVELANLGKTPLEILQHYYGKDISIIKNAEVSDKIASYPGFVLKIGDVGDHIRIIKRQLNRIANNYPAIPKLDSVHEYFDVLLENVVRTFQEIFDLNVSGKIDKATWYKIKYVYNAVKKISDLYAEGVTLEELDIQYGLELKKGDQGIHVQSLHYFLGVIAYFDKEIPLLDINAVFSENTEKMVQIFQREHQLEPTGIVDSKTWSVIKDSYIHILSHLPQDVLIYQDEIYPGVVLSLGMQGHDVLTLQQFLQEIHKKNPTFPSVSTSSCFDQETKDAVLMIQKEYGLEANGTVGPLEWMHIVEKSKQ